MLLLLLVNLVSAELRLTYFNLQGRAEHVRLLLEDSGVQWKNVITGGDEWKKAKAEGVADGSLMFGQLPALYDSDYGHIVQSTAILRHLGRKLYKYGSDPVRVDMIIEGTEDWRTPYLKLIYTEELSEEALETYRENIFKPMDGTTGGKRGGLIAQFENIVKSSGTTYVAGEDTTIADYALFQVIDNNLCICPDLFTDAPNLEAWYNTMKSRPNLATYLNSSPEHRVKVNGNGLGNCKSKGKAEL